MNNTFIFLNSQRIGALGAILEDLAANVSAGGGVFYDHGNDGGK
jgi:hypothetical protein